MSKTILFALLFAVILMAACQAPPAAGPLQASASPIVLGTFAPPAATLPPTRTPKRTLAPTFTPLPTGTAFPSMTAPPSYPMGPCSYVGAYQEQPELSAAFRHSLEASGLSVVYASVSAFGADCIYWDGSSADFQAARTDLFVSLATADLTDQAALGGLLDRVLTVLALYPPSSLPGDEPGWVSVTFASEDEELNIWFDQESIVEARKLGLSGEALYEFLSSR